MDKLKVLGEIFYYQNNEGYTSLYNKRKIFLFNILGLYTEKEIKMFLWGRVSAIKE